VLNALILANDDARERRHSAATQAAFDNMWALQQTAGADRGAWLWIRFDNEPWEAYDSVYYGATLAALAVGIVGGDYRAQPEIQDALARLRQYLNDRYEAQTPLNRIALLWASAQFPGLLDHERRQQIIDDIWKHQLPDGGWSAASLVGNWRFEDGSPLVVRSDGYATGLIIVSLQQSGLARDPRLIRGLAWLAANQSRWTGRWTGYSLNRRHRSLLHATSQFMDDAATAYAVLALTGDATGGVAAPPVATRN
jgi:squalene-hopene/tetraprenyl-beta-curcumene cyclase